VSSLRFLTVVDTSVIFNVLCVVRSSSSNVPQFDTAKYYL
jgi:hypothetical protein